jgi:V/A-type H+-transporting ATPase subunit I
LSYVKGLERIRKQLQGRLEIAETVNGMADVANMVYLRGYIPFDKQNILQEAARKQGWGLVIEDPSEEDKVPTLIRNPRWVSIINPVFKIMEVVPGYREFDISPWFLVFLSIFFGMIIGDAGYGLIYLLITLYFQRKFSARVKNKTPFYLSYLFSFCAIAWGLMTATFFGKEWLAARSIRPLIPALADDKSLRNLCFLIGAVHLSIAHTWRILTQFPSLVFLAELGWILILWSAFLLARFLVLDIDFPWFGKWLLIPGILLVVLFSNPRRNPLRAVVAGLGTLALNLMNNFTDIVSYIRLFAVGLATVAMADAFNNMAAGTGIKGILGLLIGGIIIFAGHGLNIILGPMSVLVHGVRLNVLEFCSHLDVKWSGFEYKPLQENSV